MDAPPPAPAAPARPTPPKQDCPDSNDCIADASEIGHICSYGPICGTCIVYPPRELARGLLAGTCRIRPERGVFPCTAPICDAFVRRGGALDARGRPTDGGQPSGVRTAKAAARFSRSIAQGGARGAGRPAEPPPKIPDGPCGELEMTKT